MCTTYFTFHVTLKTGDVVPEQVIHTESSFTLRYNQSVSNLSDHITNQNQPESDLADEVIVLLTQHAPALLNFPKGKEIFFMPCQYPHLHLYSFSFTPLLLNTIVPLVAAPTPPQNLFVSYLRTFSPPLLRVFSSHFLFFSPTDATPPLCS